MFADIAPLLRWVPTLRLANPRQALPWLLLAISSPSPATPDAGSSHVPPTPPTAVTQPAKGLYLVATPDMPDPRFRHTVILLVEHGTHGSMGLVLNRPSNTLLSDIETNLSAPVDSTLRVFFGGPVAMDMLMFLVRGETPEVETRPVDGSLRIGHSRPALEQLLKLRLDDDQLRVYAGHAGWTAGQLENELEARTWLLFRASEELAFSGDTGGLWHRLIRHRAPRGILALK